MSTLVASNASGSLESTGLKTQVSAALRAVWRALERVGQARAGAELGRQARHFRGFDPQRAALFEQLAADCRRPTTSV